VKFAAGFVVGAVATVLFFAALAALAAGWIGE
jgi:hypothetical protein